METLIAANFSAFQSALKFYKSFFLKNAIVFNSINYLFLSLEGINKEALIDRREALIERRELPIKRIHK
jgi:hypothetical protein